MYIGISVLAFISLVWVLIIVKIQQQKLQRRLGLKNITKVLYADPKMLPLLCY